MYINKHQQQLLSVAVVLTLNELRKITPPTDREALKYFINNYSDLCELAVLLKSSFESEVTNS